MTRVLQRILSPLGVLSILGGMTGGFWLLGLHELQLLIAGFFAGVIFLKVFPFLDLPALGLGLAAVSLANKGMRLLPLSLRFLGYLWSNLVMLAWSLAVFAVAAKHASPEHNFPFLLWGYGVALVPINFIAKSSEPSVMAPIIAVCSTVIYVSFVFLAYVEVRLDVQIIFLVIMALTPPILSTLLPIDTLTLTKTSGTGSRNMIIQIVNDLDHSAYCASVVETRKVLRVPLRPRNEIEEMLAWGPFEFRIHYEAAIWRGTMTTLKALTKPLLVIALDDILAPISKEEFARIIKATLTDDNIADLFDDDLLANAPISKAFQVLPHARRHFPSFGKIRVLCLNAVDRETLDRQNLGSPPDWTHGLIKRGP